jgi:hypothetical protein
MLMAMLDERLEGSVGCRSSSTLLPFTPWQFDAVSMTPFTDAFRE